MPKPSILTVNDAGLHEGVVDGHVYEFAKWGAQESLNTLLEMAALVGGPLGKLAAKGFLAGVEQGSMTQFNLDEDLLGHVWDQLAESLLTRRDEVMRLITRLATRDVLCDGKLLVPPGKNAAACFDVHYKDGLPHLFQVCRAALEVQYGNFFGALGDLVQRSPPPVQAAA